jgi:hypothetical protein
MVGQIHSQGTALAHQGHTLLTLAQSRSPAEAGIHKKTHGMITPATLPVQLTWTSGKIRDSSLIQLSNVYVVHQHVAATPSIILSKSRLLCYSEGWYMVCACPPCRIVEYLQGTGLTTSSALKLSNHGECRDPLVWSIVHTPTSTNLTQYPTLQQNIRVAKPQHPGFPRGPPPWY